MPKLSLFFAAIFLPIPFFKWIKWPNTTCKECKPLVNDNQNFSLSCPTQVSKPTMEPKPNQKVALISFLLFEILGLIKELIWGFYFQN